MPLTPAEAARLAATSSAAAGCAEDLAAAAVQHQRPVAGALQAAFEVGAGIEYAVGGRAVEGLEVSLDQGGEIARLRQGTAGLVLVFKGNPLAGRDPLGNAHVGVIGPAVILVLALRWN